MVEMPSGVKPRNCSASFRNLYLHRPCSPWRSARRTRGSGSVALSPAVGNGGRSGPQESRAILRCSGRPLQPCRLYRALVWHKASITTAEDAGMRLLGSCFVPHESLTCLRAESHKANARSWRAGPIWCTGLWANFDFLIWLYKGCAQVDSFDTPVICQKAESVSARSVARYTIVVIGIGGSTFPLGRSTERSRRIGFSTTDAPGKVRGISAGQCAFGARCPVVRVSDRSTP